MDPYPAEDVNTEVRHAAQVLDKLLRDMGWGKSQSQLVTLSFEVSACFVSALYVLPHFDPFRFHGLPPREIGI